MRFPCWITKATDTHSEYVILIAFSRQQWLRELAPNVTFIRTLPVLYIFSMRTNSNYATFEKYNVGAHSLYVSKYQYVKIYFAQNVYDLSRNKM
jgi:hypothetical protein